MAETLTSFPLIHLPEELISVVASQVSSSTDLFHLALTSKQLNRITTPHLYRHVSLFFGPEYRHYKVLFNFLILLLWRPQLAAYVQHLTIRGEWKREWNAGKGRRIDELHPVLQAAIERLTPDRKSKRAWADNVLGWDREEALFAILLHELPNLHTLDTSFPEQPGIHYKWLMRQIANRPAKCLGKLRDLVLVFLENTPPVETAAYMSWFSLPSLKRVFLYGVGVSTHLRRGRSGSIEEGILKNRRYLTWAVERRASRTTPLSTVEHLEVREGFSSFEPICDLIASCGGLRTFLYDDCYNGDELYSSLAEALSMHTSTLTALYLGDTGPVYRHFVGSGSPGYPDYRHLSNLKHLRVDIQTLVALSGSIPVWRGGLDQFVPNFPPGLQKLSVVFYIDTGLGSLSDLAYLLEHQPSKCPSLRELSVYSEKGAESGEEMDTALWCHAARHGVRLRMFLRCDNAYMDVERGWGIGEDISWAPVSHEAFQISDNVSPLQVSPPRNVLPAYIEYMHVEE
ncbi:hypothetical protein K458DRAFT_410622 [Lentithecium fluviatile CBS 122367]|uniref:F-box domain-containing protein n=1 Tax=Lentithecium fluviatile CBS 122367 TaxID=1168545 RepID=A0A6G1IDI3_9PLEO|nr:hypothetical protein K458DRAFT_410622 [Lentithecium fluviatile CBS 122367]